jgi:hypothetical protein
MKAFRILLIIILVIAFIYLYNYNYNSTQEHFQNIPSPTVLSYDIPTSRDAHTYAFQKVCEDKGLNFINDGINEPYCIIDNEARCNQRNIELKSSGKTSFWYDDGNGGVCIEMLNQIKPFCDGFNLQTLPGFLQCDRNNGVCYPIGYAMYTGTSSDLVPTQNPDDIIDDQVHNLTTCLIYNNDSCKNGIARFQSGPTTSSGQSLGDCVAPQGLEIASGLLGTSTVFSRFNAMGTAMVDACKQYGSSSQECWKAFGNVLAVPGDIGVKMGNIWAKDVAPRILDTWNRAMNNPSFENTLNLMITIKQNTPKGWTNQMIGHAMDQILSLIPGEQKYTGGIVQFLMENKGMIPLALTNQVNDLLRRLAGDASGIPPYQGSGYISGDKNSNQVSIPTF